jgi:hypothetical protein
MSEMGTFGSAGGAAWDWDRREEVDSERRVTWREHGVELNSDKTEVDLMVGEYSESK